MNINKNSVVKGSYRSWIGVIAAMLVMRLTLVLPANAQRSGNLENILRVVLRAVEDIEAAETFSQVRTAIDSNETVWKDRRTVAVLNSILASPSLGSDVRFRRQVERELALDCQRYGGEVAAHLLSARILAVSAVSAQSVREFAAMMGRFSELAESLSPTLVRAALRPAAGNYPPALLSLMEQLGRDWPRYGALNAATRMAQSAQKRGFVKRSRGGSNRSTFDRRYSEDRTAEKILELGHAIPDGLIMNPVYP